MESLLSINAKFFVKLYFYHAECVQYENITEVRGYGQL